MAYVALANVTDALNRMLSEPRRKQKNATEFHQFVVLNYMLASHTATLASYNRRENPMPAEKEYLPVMDAVLFHLSETYALLQRDIIQTKTETAPPQNLSQTIALPVIKDAKEEISAKEGLRKMNDYVTAMVTKRKGELEQGILESPARKQLAMVKSVNDQFNFIAKISEDLLKVAGKWKLEGR